MTGRKTSTQTNNPELLIWTLQSLNLDTFIVANRDFSQKSTQTYEPSHLDLHCLQRYLYWSVGIKGLTFVLVQHFCFLLFVFNHVRSTRNGVRLYYSFRGVWYRFSTFASTSKAFWYNGKQRRPDQTAQTCRLIWSTLFAIVLFEALCIHVFTTVHVWVW